MIRTTKPNLAPMQGRLQVMSELVSRLSYAAKLGLSYQGARDINKVLGYADNLCYADYFFAFKRQDIAKAIIDRPVKATWSGPVELLESTDADTTQLETQWNALYDELGLKGKFMRADRLAGLGRYSVLLLGFSDIQNSYQWALPVSKTVGLKLAYVRPVSEANAEIKTWVTEPTDPRFGLPESYQVKLSQAHDTTTINLLVHHSRLIHIVDDPIENEVYGTPRLEVVFNRLQDLQKLVGGSAEMFWRGARPGYQAKVDDKFTLGTEERNDLKTQVDEFEHNLRRIFINEGVDLTALQQQVSEPGNHVDVQIMMISAVTGIPKRILTGSERGELASSQDQDAWNGHVKSRREEFAEPQIIRPFVERLIELGILPAPGKEGWSAKWQDLYTKSDKDLAELGKVRSESLRNYAANPGAEAVVPVEAFLEFFLGLSTEQIELISQMRTEAILEEEKQMREAEDDMIDPIPEDVPEETETEITEETKPIKQ